MTETNAKPNLRDLRNNFRERGMQLADTWHRELTLAEKPIMEKFEARSYGFALLYAGCIMTYPKNYKLDIITDPKTDDVIGVFEQDFKTELLRPKGIYKPTSVRVICLGESDAVRRIARQYSGLEVQFGRVREGESVDSLVIGNKAALSIKTKGMSDDNTCMDVPSTLYLADSLIKLEQMAFDCQWDYLKDPVAFENRIQERKREEKRKDDARFINRVRRFFYKK